MAEFLFKDRVTATPNRIKLTKVADDTYDVEKIPGEVAEEGTPLNAATMNKLAQKDGTNTALMNTVFTEAETRANIASGETHATLFGKIRKFFADLKAHAFNDLATALGTETNKAPTNKLLYDEFAKKANAAVYKTLDDSRLTGITTASTPSDVAAAMANNSLLEANTTGYANIVPAGITDTNGIITIHKVNQYRCYMFWSYQTWTVGRLFYGTYRSDTGFKGWYEITSSKDISTVMPISSAAASNAKVLSEKVVYDEFARADSSFTKQYKTIPELGLSGGVTTVQVLNAMLDNSLTTLGINSLTIAAGNLHTITDLPAAFGDFIAYKTLNTNATGHRFLVLLSTSTAGGGALYRAVPTTSGTTVTSVAWEKILTDKDIPYDKIIRTQAEFDALIASETWLGATSVALVGQFTYDKPNNSGIKIPSTVKQIHGFNNAKITITNFVHHPDTAKGGLWYDTRPTTLDYSIRDLEVDCTGSGSSNRGFYNCTNLTNCAGTGTGTGSYGYGFYFCTNLTNCTGTGTGTGSEGYGFRDCTNLTNCTGTGTGTGTGAKGYGFGFCANLTNCAGTGTGTTGYGFYYITYASNCMDGGSTTNMWSGTNTNIDLDTCRKTPVTADLTELNT